ncbi:MAG TPA: FAD/NAD(P)-binding oxidoreductase [Chryseosolibacter sp.]
MKQILILGAGTAGTMMANKLRKSIPEKEWQIKVVDKDPLHYYQPGFLFIPFGIYEPRDIIREKREFLGDGIDFLVEEVAEIKPVENKVVLKSGDELFYDILVIATGSRVVPEETEGLKDALWHKDIFDFYTYEGSTRLAEKLATWEGGKLVINLAESIIKCPVAPLEFSFLADAYFTEKGMRDKVDITFATPLSGAFTKPKATEMLTKLLREKNINVVADFYLSRVDNERKVLVSYDDRELPFDLLVTIPLNKGSELIGRSGIGDDDGLDFVPTNKFTLQYKNAENIFVLGDATNIPTSKAGSVAHFEAEILTENILSFIAGAPMKARFDGHSNCFIETGHGKAVLIDFNYDVQPLKGKFPFPVIGPLGLLKVSRANHWGKLAFRWVYWHILLTGKKLPIPAQMTMAGKEVAEEA